MFRGIQVFPVILSTGEQEITSIGILFNLILILGTFGCPCGAFTNDPSPKSIHTSELSRYMTPEIFEKVYVEFLRQADENTISKKGRGPRYPDGICTGTDGHHLMRQMFRSILVREEQARLHM